jgi:hypothetical protein
MFTYPLDRLRDVWARHGFLGTLRLLPHNMALAIRACAPARRRARRAAIAFDRRHGIDTATPAALSSLDIDPARARHGVEYTPSRIDLGSGKGRTLLIASHFPFRRIIGVEISEKLTAIARANIAVYHPPEQRCRQIEAIVGDAGEFELPDGPLVVYVYNAFRVVILTEVAARLAGSLERAPRDLLLIYVNPVHRHVLDKLSCLAIARESEGTVIYRARPDTGRGVESMAGKPSDREIVDRGDTIEPAAYQATPSRWRALLRPREWAALSVFMLAVAYLIVQAFSQENETIDRISRILWLS